MLINTGRTVSTIMNNNALRRAFVHLNSTRHYRCSVKHFSPNANVDATASLDSNNVTNSTAVNSDEAEQFRFLLRNSNFINLGDPENKIIIGRIFHIVMDDLYIDFGWKFHCVCPRPDKDSELYVRGAEVLLRIKSLELSSHFLGSEKALTLLEADASIMRLISSPKKKEN